MKLFEININNKDLLEALDKKELDTAYFILHYLRREMMAGKYFNDALNEVADKFSISPNGF